MCILLFVSLLLLDSRLRLESQFRQFTLGKHPGLTANFRRIHWRDSSHCTKNDAMKEFRRAGFHTHDTGTDQELHTLGGYELLTKLIRMVARIALKVLAIPKEKESDVVRGDYHLTLEMKF